MAYEYKELKDANGDTFKVAVVQVESDPNSIFSSLVLLESGDNPIGGTKDNGAQWTTSWGVSGAPIESDISASATAVTDVPTTDQKLVIDDIFVHCSVAQVLTFTEETTGTVLFKRSIPANQTIQFTPRGRRKLATANKKLMCQSSAATATYVEVGYHSEA